MPALVTGSEDGVLRVQKVLINEASKQISGIEMVTIECVICSRLTRPV